MRTNKPLFLIVASAAVTASIPSWGATLDANVESFLTSDFNLVTSDVQFRFTELAPASGDNLSTHILIDGLVPVEDGSDVLTSNYRGINITTGDEYDVGQVTLTLPSGSSATGASSPIVGIVARNTPSGSSGWSAYTNSELTGTQIGGASGTVDIDPAADGTMTFNLSTSAGALTGSATYTVVDSSTIDVDAFSLTDPSGTYDFAAMELAKFGESWYAIMMSTSADLTSDYDSLMYTLRLGTGGSDVWGGYNVITNPDGSKWADATSNWLGYLNIDSDPFIFSFEMNTWMFLTEPSGSADGAWFYAFKRSASSPVAGWGGYPVITNPDGSKWADATSNWLGYLNIDNAPFIFSFETQTWIYMTEPDGAAGGAWGYGIKD